MNADIIYDGFVVGRGIVRSIDVTSLFVEIQDFPLEGHAFLELAIPFNDGELVRIPVRLLENTGDGVEIVLERVEPMPVEALQ